MPSSFGIAVRGLRRGNPEHAAFSVRPRLLAAPLFAGILADPLLPAVPLPQVELPTVHATTQQPDASRETTAAMVTAPLERQFAQIPGVALLSSTKTCGVS